jgi:hypothetical protein
MDLDAPKFPTQKEWAAYLRYKRWQDRIAPDTRPRLSHRTFVYFVALPVDLAALGCTWWGAGSGRPARPFRIELLLLGIALPLLLLLVRRMFRIRPAPDA